MPLTAKLYEQYRAVRDGKAPRPENMSDEYFSAAMQGVKDFEEEFLHKGGDASRAGAQLAPLPESPTLGIKGVIGAPQALPTQDQLASEVMKRLDPGLSLPAQGLATQPATTHPKGDKAAADEWLRGEMSNPNGTVIVYEMPLQKLREHLLSHPEMMPALGYEHLPPSTDYILNLSPSDSLFSTAQDHLWRQQADALAKQGKTAYRYAKAPVLQKGGLTDKLGSLALKFDAARAPAAEGLTALVMGVDKNAAFGVGTRAGELLDTALHPEGQGPAPEGTAGGIAGVEGASPREVNDMIRQEHPIAHGVGQAIGFAPGLVKKGLAGVAGWVGGDAAKEGVRALAPWSASNAIFDGIAHYANKAAGAVGLGESAKVAARTLGSALGGAAGAVAASAGTQLGQEAVDLGFDLAEHGAPQSTGDEAWGRIADAGLGTHWPASVGAAGGVLQSLAKGGANWVREGEHYGKRPGRFEKFGGQWRFGRGPVADEVDDILKRAENAVPELGGQVPPVDIAAGDIAAKVEAAADDYVQSKIQKVGDKKAEVFASPEGQAPLRVNKFAGSLLGKLDETYAREVSSEPYTPVGVPQGGKTIKGLFNLNTRTPSLERSEGAIPIEVDRAAAYLDKKKLTELMKAPVPETVPKGKGGGRGGGPSEPFVSETKKTPGRIEPQRVITTHGEPQAPPPLVERLEPQATPGVGSWKPTRGIDEAEAIAPSPQLDAVSTLENHTRQADVQSRLRGVDRYSGNPTNPPVMKPASNEPRSALHGTRQSVHGKPPPPTLDPDTGKPYPLEPRPEPAAELAKAPGAAKPRPSTAGKALSKKAKPGTLAAESETKEARTFIDDMKAKGVTHVYVTPRAYTAQQHERALRLLHRVGQDNINDRDIGELRKALFADRDERLLGASLGVADKWSRVQGQHEEMIREAKDTEARVAPKNDSRMPGGRATPKLIQRSKQQEGEAEDLRALARIGIHGGILPELRRLRLIEPYLDVKAQSSFGKVDGHHRTLASPAALIDWAMLRGGYPVMRQLEGPLGPIGMGKAARGVLYENETNSEDAKKRRAARTDEPAKSYGAAREEKIKDLSDHSRKKRRK